MLKNLLKIIKWWKLKEVKIPKKLKILIQYIFFFQFNLSLK